jgi:hypothetical protein
VTKARQLSSLDVERGADPGATRHPRSSRAPWRTRTRAIPAAPCTAGRYPHGGLRRPTTLRMEEVGVGAAAASSTAPLLAGEVVGADQARELYEQRLDAGAATAATFSDHDDACTSERMPTSR